MIPGLEIPDAPHGCGVPPKVPRLAPRRDPERFARAAYRRAYIAARPWLPYRVLARQLGVSTHWVGMLARGAA